MTKVVSSCVAALFTSTLEEIRILETAAGPYEAAIRTNELFNQCWKLPEVLVFMASRGAVVGPLVYYCLSLHNYLHISLLSPCFWRESTAASVCLGTIFLVNYLRSLIFSKFFHLFTFNKAPLTVRLYMYRLVSLMSSLYRAELRLYSLYTFNYT